MSDSLPLQLLSLDLFFQSRIQGHASVCGWELQQIARVDQIGTNETVRGVVVDLELPGLDFDMLCERSKAEHLPAVGYGSHVKTHLFDAAREAGLERLYSRGEIDARGAEILESCFGDSTW